MAHYTHPQTVPESQVMNPHKGGNALHNLKPNYFGVAARNRTCPGEEISFLVKKIHLYANSIFTEEDTPRNARG